MENINEKINTINKELDNTKQTIKSLTKILTPILREEYTEPENESIAESKKDVDNASPLNKKLRSIATTIQGINCQIQELRSRADLEEEELERVNINIEGQGIPPEWANTSGNS